MRNPLNRGSSTGRARDAAARLKASEQMSKPDFAEVSKQPTKSRKKNALTHGIYGKDILLPWESREEFEKLLVELQDEFQPSGRMENEIVSMCPICAGKNPGCTRCGSLQLTATLLCQTWSRPVKSRGRECATT
jgi:hypothetical protein